MRRCSPFTFSYKLLLYLPNSSPSGPWIGPALVPYYRQLLPIPNLFRDCNVNIGDQIDFQGGNRVGDVIDVTLQMLERHGGPDAYLNIKYMVPTYESCVLNR